MTTLTEVMAKYRDTLLDEAWDTEMHTAKKDKGMFKNKGKEEIKSALDKETDEAAKLRKKGKVEPPSLKKKIKQKEFALRAKNKFGKVEETFLKESAHPKMEAILQKYSADVDKFIENGFDLMGTSQEFQYALYEYYVADMPYGVAKARTGDPDEFITEHFSKYLEDNGLLPDGNEMPANFLTGPDLSTDLDTEDSWGESKFNDYEGVNEGKTTRKCKGKGCSKMCPDGKDYCCKKCQSNTMPLKKEVPIKKFKESAMPGPFSKNGTIAKKLAETKGYEPRESSTCKVCNVKLPKAYKYAKCEKCLAS